MRTKNNLLLGLVLGVIMLVSVTGFASAVTEQYDRPCASVDICDWEITEVPGSDLGLPLGSTDNSGCGLSYNTYWPINTMAKATCEFDGDHLEEAMLYISINNDIVSCTLNGNPIFESTSHEGCAPVDPRDGFSEELDSAIIDGTNTLICELNDRGIMTHFDACVVAEEYEQYCNLVVDEPELNDWFDNEAVPIHWYLEGNACTPIDHFWLYTKQDGDCTDLDHGWDYLADGSNAAFGDNPYNYLWDKPSESGQYCVKVKVTSNGARDSSEVFNVDHAKPEVSLSVGNNNFGDCAEESAGTCYVNQETPMKLGCTDENPDEPWQSGVDYMEYRYSVNGGEFTEWIMYQGPFTFPEDSNHVLEYRCFDKVDKVDTETKTFVVESDVPELDRTVTGPQVCPEEDGDGCTEYFNLDTEICVNLVNFPEHEIPGVAITCDWWYGDEYGEILPSHHGEFTLEDGGCFSYTEDSYHSLECKVTDALENSYERVWEDVVDALAPTTSLAFEGPHYTNDISEWIDGVSTVVLTANDQKPHPVGDVITYYRYKVVADSNCENPRQVQWEPTSKEAEGWMIYEEPFGMEESCHVIEYYSVDALANSEDVHHKFVFVDKTAPELFKEVGKPSHDCNGLWEDITGECQEGWDWIVTTNTPIYLSCEDQLPHPSGVDELCYKITWDGGEASYPEEARLTQEGYHCFDVSDGEEVPVYFYEECEHTLEFYCVDNVGKTTDVDREIFKVEGKPFEIPLDKKWNLISFPFNLLSNNVEEVFDDISEDIEGVWSYENGEWLVYTPEGPSDLTEVVPGRGYWVKTTDSTSILVGGELMSEGQMIPPSVELDKGWNLIGHYGTMPKPAYCSLFSLVDTQEGFPRWSALWGYSTISNSFYPLNSLTQTLPGKGYWIEMDVNDEYSPATTCWGLPSA